jgi:hypothetical protein
MERPESIAIPALAFVADIISMSRQSAGRSPGQSEAYPTPAIACKLRVQHVASRWSCDADGRLSNPGLGFELTRAYVDVTNRDR